MKTSDQPALARALAAAFKTLRERAAISQEDLAHATGVGRAHLSKIERGFGNPELTTLYKLLLHLKTDFTAFGAELDGALRKRPAKGA